MVTEASGRLWRGIGLAFCFVWTYAVLLFPILKANPHGYVPVAVGVLAALALAGTPALSFLNARLSRVSAGRFLSWAILIGMALRVVPLVLFSAALVSDAAVYHEKALDLLHGRGFGPTAFLPPGLPAMLAAWYWITVPDPRAGCLLGALFSVAAIPLAYDVGRRSLGPLAARWAAVLAAVLPTLVFTGSTIHTSSFLSFAYLAAGDLMLISRASGRKAWAAPVALGLVFGFGSLVKPILLLGPVVALLSWLATMDPRRALLRVVVCSLTAGAVIVPWTVRNYGVVGGVVLVSTNGGNVLYHGTNPESDGMWTPSPPTAIPGRELQIARAYRSAALRRVAEDPAAFVRLVVRKQAYMWGTSTTNVAVDMHPALPPSMGRLLGAAIKGLINAAWAALLVLCVLGTLRTPVWNNPRLRPMVLLLLMLFALHLVYEVQSRYHIPAIGTLILIAAAGLAAGAGGERPPGGLASD